MLQSNFAFVDLFSGLGGFHVAMSRLGGRCVMAAEWQPHLQALYEKNFGLAPEGDIRLVDPTNVPDHDILCAGFPCQPFSKAGEQLGFECTTQGNLFFNVAAILEEKKPNFLLLENVPNLLQHDNGRTFEKISQLLIERGYSIAAKKYSPHEFGVPQIRERIYIIGSRLGLDKFQWPDKSKLATSITSVLDKNPTGARSLSKQVLSCLEVWNEFLSRAPKALKLPSFPIWSMEFGADYPYTNQTPFALFADKGTRGLAKFRGSHGIALSELAPDDRWDALPSHARTPQSQFPLWKQIFIRQNREFYEANRDWIDPWLPKLKAFPSSLQKFEWNVQGGERDIWKYVLQFRASGVRVKRASTAPSLIAMTDTQVPIIGWEKRYMTPAECARLQSLGDIELPSSPTKAFHALGNAVNSDVVQAIASRLLSSAPKLTKGENLEFAGC